MKIIKTKTTKGKRFSITTHKGYTGDYMEWRAQYNNEISQILKKYLKLGYTEVKNMNGGDDDYLCFDHVNKEFIWCENGFSPFYIHDLEDYEKLAGISLAQLYESRC